MGVMILVLAKTTGESWPATDSASPDSSVAFDRAELNSLDANSEASVLDESGGSSVGGSSLSGKVSMTASIDSFSGFAFHSAWPWR